MKDVLGAFGSEVLRPLASLVLPGAVAIIPYFVLVRLLFPSFSAMLSANSAETVFALLAICLFTGFILEDLGSWLEDRWDDRTDCPGLREDWYAYLRFAFKTEPVGHRYLRTLVLRLKFELGVLCGLLVGLFGVLCLGFVTFGTLALPVQVAMKIHWLFWPGVLVYVLLGVYLWFGAKQTHKTLYNLRHRMLNGDIKVIGETK